MNLIEAIKTLKPAERFKALVFVGFLTAGTTLLTVWLKGNPCEKISTQYSKMLTNYSNLAAANNQLMESDNQKQGIIIQLKGILERLDSTGGVVQTVTVESPIETQLVKEVRYINENSYPDSGIVLAKSLPDPEPVQKPKKKKQVVKFINTMTKDQRSLLDSALTITKKAAH